MSNWFNKLPKKTRIIILIAALFVIAGLWYRAWWTAVNNRPPVTTPITNNANTNTVADFKRTGTVTFNNPGLKPNTPYFIFEEPGSPALSKELIFDAKSICVSPTGESQTCMSMDTTPGFSYDEKRSTVEGISQPDGSLLITKLGFEK